MRDLLFAFFCAFFFLFFATTVKAQGSIHGRVLDRESNEPIIRAKVQAINTDIGSLTNSEGAFQLQLPVGEYQIKVTYPGYLEATQNISVKNGDSIYLEFLLKPESHEGEEVVVTGTRTERGIDDIPVRVEVVPQEEVEEKLLMRASSVSMLLSESPGVRVQNTSATSNTANLRLQGLDGRYTQILIDGIPSLTGMAAGFGVTQLAPLNLRQVEILKGGSSALYGSDAIAGVINFITKDPHEEMNLSVLTNVSSLNAFDVAAYESQMLTDDLGITTLLSYNTQALFDADNDGFSDLPHFNRVTFTPKITYKFSESVSGMLTGTYFEEKRLGGIIENAESSIGKGAPYVESNNTVRRNISGSLNWGSSHEEQLRVTGSYMELGRDAWYGATPFRGTQKLLYGDAQYNLPFEWDNMLFGVTYHVDEFDDRTPNLMISRSYAHKDIGLWTQQEIKLVDAITFLAGGRLDFHNELGAFFTPRVSLMYKPNNTITWRINGGTGFKAPTIFTEEAEERGFRNTYPPIDLSAERSRTISTDINWKFLLSDEVSGKLNAAIYSTRLDNALVVNSDSLSRNVIYYENATGPTNTLGAELTGQISYSDFTLNLHYAYLYGEQTHRGLTEELTLNPHHWVGTILMYESEELGLKAGLENYFTAPQHLERNPFRTESPSYNLTGFMAEKALGNFRVFINFENIFDTRMTRFDPLYVGDPKTGEFNPLEVYAPLEGRAINGGIRFVIE